MGSTRVAVLGASGFAGGELVRLLSGHPAVELSYLGAKDSAGRTLEALFDALDAGLADADVEFEGGIVTVELADGGRYVINRHAPNRQIWVSSPRSGAWHFERRDDQWVSTRGSERLDTLLGAELGLALDLE